MQVGDLVVAIPKRSMVNETISPIYGTIQSITKSTENQSYHGSDWFPTIITMVVKDTNETIQNFESYYDIITLDSYIKQLEMTKDTCKRRIQVIDEIINEAEQQKHKYSQQAV